jgi:16S rRNA (cytosine1402-N4)-methyltransferase
MHQNKNKHIPVLLEAVLSHLDPKPGESYLDLTAGYGGHASAILERTLNNHQAVLVDRDEQACKALRRQFGDDVQVRHDDFRHAARKLLAAGRQFDLILADLGVSSWQLDTAERGFSFGLGGPLDMRMDIRQAVTAEQIVNSYSEDRLTEILRAYGEEPKAKRIAHAIVTSRPLSTTSELAEVVKRTWAGRSKVHPATRTFQALRIAVNQELDILRSAVPVWIDLLTQGGRLAISSFHSLEDRIVKQALADVAGDRYDASLRLLTKSPVTAGPAEIAFNPRARSAKLRAAVKINTGREAHAYPGKK